MGRLTRRTKDHLGRTGIAVGVHDVYKYSPHYEAINKLAHYEDMEEQGRLIEQKHGTWEIHDEYYFCPNCYSEWKETFTYCPCCGSKNREVETDLLKELKNEKY